MGMCHEDHGNISIETRRESFVIHPDAAVWDERNIHPEFYIADLDDMIDALIEAREYLHRHGDKTGRE